jgi:MoxR-like ATPase
VIEPQMGSDVASAAYRRLVDNVRRVIAGNDAAVETAAICLFADGNLLLEGVPGVGKTTLARALAVSIGGEFSRIQATPDLLPSDLTGISIYDQHEESFRFVPGPVFANVVLVDEINRTPARTQSALLEPMEERQVTVEGVARPLPEPYVVIATENPIEQHGTYPLPEGQLDRFSLAVRVGYPDADGSLDVVRRQLQRHPLLDLEQAVSTADVLAAQHAVRAVYVDEAVMRYAVDLVSATRSTPGVALGASPRASVALVRCAQARAIAHERDHVLPDDVKALAVAALAHRLVMSAGAVDEARATVERLLGEVPVPLHVARQG